MAVLPRNQDIQGSFNDISYVSIHIVPFSHASSLVFMLLWLSVSGPVLFSVGMLPLWFFYLSLQSCLWLLLHLWKPSIAVLHLWPQLLLMTSHTSHRLTAYLYDHLQGLHTLFLLPSGIQRCLCMFLWHLCSGSSWVFHLLF